MEFDLDINWRDIRDQKIWLFNITTPDTTPWEQRQALESGHVESDVLGF